MLARALLAMALTNSASVCAESRISALPSGALSTTARLGVAVQVPRILYLAVGSTGALVNTVTFNVRLAGTLATLPVNNAVTAVSPPPALNTTQALDNHGASDGRIGVRLWTNNGSAKLNCSGLPLTAGALQIPLSAIAVTATTGATALPHPGTSLNCSTVTAGSSGINNLTGTWRYVYSPASLPAAGAYTTQITYTASQP